MSAVLISAAKEHGDSERSTHRSLHVVVTELQGQIGHVLTHVLHL